MKKCLSTSNSSQVCLSSQNDKRNTEIQQTEHKPSFVVALLSTTRRCNRLLFVFAFHIVFKLLSSFKVLDAFLSNTFFRLISLGFIYRIEPKISQQVTKYFVMVCHITGLLSNYLLPEIHRWSILSHSHFLIDLSTFFFNFWQVWESPSTLRERAS